MNPIKKHTDQPVVVSSSRPPPSYIYTYFFFFDRLLSGKKRSGFRLNGRMYSGIKFLLKALFMGKKKSLHHKKFKELCKINAGYACSI